MDASEIERLHRFGAVRSFGPGEALAKAGETALGLAIILTGHVEITEGDRASPRRVLVTHAPGGLMGELAQLGRRPACSTPMRGAWWRR